MPEGHAVHRHANDFNRLFKGQILEVESPQGRFSGSAALLDGRTFKKARAIGKQLFLEFDNKLTLRIHLGIYGKWQFHDLAESEPMPAPFGEVRARFRSSLGYADLRGPTVCEVIEPAAVAAVERRLGPDPLNPDPKGLQGERFVARVQRSKTVIGLQLMNQEVIAGIGNVYRAEILFRAGINPHSAGNSLNSVQLLSIWHDSVALLKVGVATGMMITRDDQLKKRPKSVDRYFVYKREGLPCRVCGTNISIEIMATRKLYWCQGCQH